MQPAGPTPPGGVPPAAFSSPVGKAPALTPQQHLAILVGRLRHFLERVEEEHPAAFATPAGSLEGRITRLEENLEELKLDHQAAIPLLRQRVDQLIPFLLKNNSPLAPDALSICSPQALLNLTDHMSEECGKVALHRYFAMGMILPSLIRWHWSAFVGNTILPLVGRVRSGYMTPQELKVVEHWLQLRPDLIEFMRKPIRFPDFPWLWAKYTNLNIASEQLLQVKNLKVADFLSQLRFDPDTPFPHCLIDELNASLDILQDPRRRAICMGQAHPGSAAVHLKPQVILKRLLADSDIQDLILLYQNRRNSEFIAVIKTDLYRFLKVWEIYHEDCDALMMYNLLLQIAFEAIQDGSKISTESCQTWSKIIKTWLVDFKVWRDRKIFFSHLFLLILGKYAEKRPELFTANWDLVPIIEEALKAPQTEEAKNELHKALLTIACANSELIPRKNFVIEKF